MADRPAIGLIGAGEMGAAIGAHLVPAGFEVLTELTGRSAETRRRASEAGLTEAASLGEVVERSAIAFSVVPPAIAQEVAGAVADAARARSDLVFVDANAVSPQTMEGMAGRMEGIAVVDGGIVGPPPKDGRRPRLYVSGPQRHRLDRLDGIAFDLVDAGDEIGKASAFKMTYAAVTKGTNALLTAAFLLAQHHGQLDLFMEELGETQSGLFRRAEANIARLPADAGRWVREMEEIAATFEAAGLPGGFHEGAAAVMRLLDASRFGTETRRTMDRSRTMAETVRAVGEDRYKV